VRAPPPVLLHCARDWLADCAGGEIWGSDARGCCVPSNTGWRDQRERFDWPSGIGVGYLGLALSKALRGERGVSGELAIGFKDASCGDAWLLGSWRRYIYT
jgi:hypothetical protein